MTPDITLVTTFSKQGHELYGARWISSFLEHWPREVMAEIHYEGDGPPEPYSPDEHDRILWIPLDHDEERARFLRDYSGPEHNDPRDFNGMAVRFCHKVFAVTNPWQSFLQGSGWRCWVDADVVFAPM
jgi:hypothetical protein